MVPLLMSKKRRRSVHSYVKIISKNKGGYLVSTCLGIKGFLPRSHFRRIHRLKKKENTFPDFVNFRNKPQVRKKKKKKYNFKNWFKVKLSLTNTQLNSLQLKYRRKKRKYKKKIQIRFNYVFVNHKGIHDRKKRVKKQIKKKYLRNK
jgi:hypothetical protein